MEEMDIVEELRQEEKNRDLHSKKTNVTKDNTSSHEVFNKEADSSDQGVGNQLPAPNLGSSRPCDLEEKFSQLFEAIQDAIYLADYTGHFIESNEVGYKRLGYSKEEFLALTIADIDDSEYQEYGKNLLESLKHKECVRFETVHVSKNGQKYPVEVNARSFHSESGMVILAVARDISDRKRTEKILQESELRFRSYFENNALGTVIMTNPNEPCMVNQTFADFVGYSKDELESLSTLEMIQKITHPDDLKVEMHEYNKVKDRNISEYRIEKRFIRKTGEITYADVTTKAVFDEQGNLTLAFTTVLDINEKKKVKDALEKSEIMYRLLFESSRDALMTLDIQNLYFSSANRATLEMFKATDEKMFRTARPNDVSPELQPDGQRSDEKAKYYIETALRDGSVFFEWVHKRFNGELFPATVLLTRTELDDGSIFLQATVRDITQQKNIESKLRENEEKINNMISNIPGVFYRCSSDEQRTIEYISTEIKNISGYPTSDFIGNNVRSYASIIHPSDKGFVEAEIQKSIKHRHPYNIEYRIVDKDNQIKWVHEKGRALYNPEGAITCSDGFIIDITQRIKTKESLEKAHMIINRSPAVAFLWKNQEGWPVEFVTGNVDKLFGYSANEFVSGQVSFSHVVHPDDLTRVGQEVEAYSIDTTKNEFSQQYRIIHKDGSIRWIEDKTIIQKNEEGEITHYQGIIYDITDQKEYEDELLKKNEKLNHTRDRLERLTKDMEYTLSELDQIFNNRSTAMIVFNEQTRILRVNESFLNIFNVDRNRALGKTCSEVFNFQLCGGHCSQGNCPLKRVLETKRNYVFEEEVVRHNGDKLFFTVSAAPYLSVDGNIRGVILSFNDITQIREDEEQMLKMNEELIKSQEETEDYVAQLEEKTAMLELANEKLQRSEERILKQNENLKKLDELKSTFLNVTSHELRTPMSSIKGYVQMMLKSVLGVVTEEQTKALQVILRNTNRLDNLIQDILDISRLESGTMKFVPEQTDLSKMLRDIWETMSSACKDKNITLQIDVDESLPMIVIDKDRVTQVIINLLNNAIKFSPQDSTIILRGFRKDETVVFEVHDQGRGVPKDKQTRIFETFYQVDSGMDRKFGGAGLGLAISRGIVLAHGGNIWVESNGVTGEGSIFRFTLPVQEVQNIEKRFQQIDVFRLGGTEEKNDEVTVKQ